MLTASHIKPISYLKANAAQVLRDLAEQRAPLVITQNGEATAVLQDIASYEQDQQTLALLKILALGRQQIEQGHTVAADLAIAAIRQRRLNTPARSTVTLVAATGEGIHTP